MSPRIPQTHPRQKKKTNQLLKHTVVQLHLGLPTLPHMVVVVLQTLPVRVELLQAVGVDLLDTAFLAS